MKKLILIVMLALCTVTITSRPVQTYAYTEEQKQQAKAWLSAHGYPPTRAGAEQAYQDYMDGERYWLIIFVFVNGRLKESNNTDLSRYLKV